MHKGRNVVRLVFVWLMIAVVAVFSMPVPVSAEKSKKTVRVGWHESPHFITDQYGRKTGYSYEYQRKVAAYTGWDYQYVNGTWSDLMEMLKKGEINLSAENKWDEIDIAYGLAIYDSDIDDYLTDTVNRADKIMYDNKAKAKTKAGNG
ncbi:MAG: transporter substrate-binding domain-containing protein [Saccharofermentans sp.]|nr:transporter substrate-binding domain-containing protein [Saccharofermentans sp.]